VAKDSDWLKQVIDSVAEAVVAVDAHGVIVTINPLARSIMGIALDSPLGDWTTSIGPLLRSASGERLADDEQPIARALRGEAVPVGDFVLLQGTKQLVLEVRAAPLRAAHGAVIGAVACFSDVTEKKAAEAVLTRDADRLSVLAADLDAARRAAERSNQYKSRFLAGMSHELRTPLNAVIGFSELLEQQTFGPLNEKQQNYVVNVLSSGRHLLAIVNDILDLSRVEAGRFEIVREFTPLHTIVESALSVVESLRVKHGVRVVRELPGDLPELYVDPVRIKQVLYNLLSNAIKFSPRGSRVDVSAHAEGGVLEISIQDRGSGIQRQDLPKLFREFEQLAPAPGERAGGTGLGLALSKRLVELHGGSIGVESEFGRGSRFWVRLPVLDRTSTRIRIAQRGEPHVLIAQYDSVSARILQEQLRVLEIDSVIAVSATDALEKLSEVGPIAIAVDVDAEGTDGWALIELVKNDVHTKHIPLLAVLDSSDAVSARYLGDVTALYKPFTAAELGTALAKLGVALPSAAGSVGSKT
jgi:PAS domain S-box-containing protein